MVKNYPFAGKYEEKLMILYIDWPSGKGKSADSRGGPRCSFLVAKVLKMWTKGNSSYLNNVHRTVWSMKIIFCFASN